MTEIKNDSVRRNRCKTPEWIADLEMACFDLEIQEFLEEHAFFRIFAARCFHEIFRIAIFSYHFSLKAVSCRVINPLLTKLARERTGRISALGLFCTDLATLGPYCQDLGPIFSQYGPRAWLIGYINSYYLIASQRIKLLEEVIYWSLLGANGLKSLSRHRQGYFPVSGGSDLEVRGGRGGGGGGSRK